MQDIINQENQRKKKRKMDNCRGAGLSKVSDERHRQKGLSKRGIKLRIGLYFKIGETR